MKCDHLNGPEPSQADDRIAVLKAIRQRRKTGLASAPSTLNREEKLRLSHEAVLREEIEWGETIASLRRDPGLAKLMNSDDWKTLESLRLEVKSELHFALRPYRDRLLEELDPGERAAAAEVRSRYGREIESIEEEMARQLHTRLPERDRRVITEQDVKEILSQEDPGAEVWRHVVLDLGGPHDPPVVLGVRQRRVLTDARRHALEAMLRAGPNGLTKDQLDAQSGHSETRKILLRLAESSAQWREIILFPGDARNGYRLREDCWPPTKAH